MRAGVSAASSVHYPQVVMSNHKLAWKLTKQVPQPLSWGERFLRLYEFKPTGPIIASIHSEYGYGGRVHQLPWSPPTAIRPGPAQAPDDDAPELNTHFEFEGWRIESWDSAPKEDCDWISHYCPSVKWRYSIDQWEAHETEACPRCGYAIPDPVMALWRLKNFDRLPNRTECDNMLGRDRIITQHNAKIWGDSPY